MTHSIITYDEQRVPPSPDAAAPAAGKSFVPDVSPFAARADKDPVEFIERELALHQAAHDAAEALLTELGYTRVPLDPFDVAQRMGLAVEYRTLNGDDVRPGDEEWVAGILEKLEGHPSATLYIEARDDMGALRFAAAHEIAHWRQYTQGKTASEIRQAEFYCLCEPNDQNTPDEYSADLFAHMLLLPQFLMLRELANGYSSATIAEHLGVSQRIVDARIRNIALTQL